MKKSKILLPALAVLVLSSTAAATGTYAWFSASRTQAVTGSSLTVMNANAGLKATLGDVKGCAQDVAEASAIKILFGNTDGLIASGSKAFRDASVDMTSGKVYRPLTVSDKGVPGSYTEVTTPNLDDNGVYCANTFEIKFNLTEKSTEKEYLYFDSTLSRSETAKLNAAETGEIRTSLRVGMKSSSNEYVVWAPFRDTLTGGNDDYINGTSESSIPTTNIASDTPFPTTFTGSDTPEQALVAAQVHNNFLGTVDNQNTETFNTVTVYVWFEGTDDDCTDAKLAASNETQGFKLDLRFNIGQLKHTA